MAGGPVNAPGRSSRPFDAGLQPERTALAWRRTSLAVAVASLAALRILPELVGFWALIPAALVAGMAFVALLLRTRVALGGGVLPALMPGATVAGGALALVAALQLSDHVTQ